MSHQEGDERCQGHNHEKWQAGNPRCLPRMWNQDVPDREELNPGTKSIGVRRKAGYLHHWISSLLVSIAHYGLLLPFCCSQKIRGHP